MRIRVGSAVLAALVLSASGCSGGEGATSDFASPSSSPGNQHDNPAEIPVPESDRKTAESAVLTINDLPMGSTTRGSAKSDVAASSPSWKNTPDFLACMQMDQAALTIVGPWAESPNFTVPGKGIVGSRVTLASSVDAVINGTRIYHDSRYASCGLSSLRSQQVPEGLSFESVEALSFPKLGDDTAAYRTIVSANINGKATTGIQDAVLIRVGRAQVAMEFDGDNATPFPIDEAHRLAQIVVARLPR